MGFLRGLTMSMSSTFLCLAHGLLQGQSAPEGLQLQDGAH